jgi:hypothetical protein
MAAEPRAVRGATVDEVRYDPTSGAIKVLVRNTSQKDITAFGLSFTAKLPDGSTDHWQTLVDLLPSLMAQDQARPSETAIKPGTTHEERSLAGAVNGERPTEVNVASDVVAYIDRTAEIADTAAFDRLVNDRRTTGDALVAATRIIRKHLSSTGETSIAEKCSDEIRQKRAGSHASDRLAYEAVLRDVANAGRIEESHRRERLDDSATLREHQAALFLEHANLRGAQ